MYGIRTLWRVFIQRWYYIVKKEGKKRQGRKTKRKIHDVNEELIDKPRTHVAFSNIIRYAQIYDIHVHVYVP